MEALQPGDPRLVGSYRLLNRLGSGGMGRVFLGRSPGGRLVAVKVIRSELAADPDFRARFAHEVAAARRVSGLYTAPLVDADPDAAEPWLVTSYVDGPSLAGAIAHKGPMPATGVLALALGLAEGLAGIHAVDVVHRDLKPSNVLLAADGPRIIDFGIARAADATVMTQAGLVVGSPGFMSPEQANGNAVGPASDVFSLGTVLAYAGTGIDPFGSGTPEVLLYRVVHGSPALDNLPAMLRPVVERCMSKDPEARPTSPDLLAMLSDLESAGPAWPDGWARMANGIARADPPARSQAVHPPSAAARPSEATHRPDVMPSAGMRTATAPMAFARAAKRRGRKAPIWIAAAAVIVIGCASAGIGLALHDSGPLRKSEPSNSAHHVATQAPATTRPSHAVKAVERFIDAINKRDWRRVWRLGGKNLGESYPSMVAGFRDTKHDKLTSIVSNGDVVNAQILAYETTGVQTIALSYTVRKGVITSGQQTVLPTQNAAPSQSG